MQFKEIDIDNFVLSMANSAFHLIRVVLGPPKISYSRDFNPVFGMTWNLVNVSDE